jgi:hypothetical protein
MDAIAAYLLKCTISSGILTIYYWLALRNKRFHYYNRFYLLAAIPISLIVPLLNFKWYHLHQPGLPYINNLLDTISSTHLSKPVFHFTWEWLLIALGMAVGIILFMILIAKIIWIYYVKYKHTCIPMNGYYLIETQLPQAPFSFLNYLFWKKGIPLQGDNGEKIFKHELTHIQQKHSYDKLLSQVVVCFFWMNPFYWIIQKELNMIHEFIADEKSIEDRDVASFAKMLLQAHNGGSYLEPSHSFNNSPVKRRLLMLTTSAQTQYSYWRRIMILPVIVLVFAIFSFTVIKGQINSQTTPDTSNKTKPVHYNIFSEKETMADTAKKPREITPEMVRQILLQTIQDPPDVMYYVNGRETSRENIKLLNPDKITTLAIYHGEDAIKRHGSKARKGAIELGSH